MTALLGQRILVVRRGFGDFVGAMFSRNLQMNWILGSRDEPLGYVPPISPGGRFPGAKLLMRPRNQSLGTSLREAFNEATAGGVYQGVDIKDLSGAPVPSGNAGTAESRAPFEAAQRGEGIAVLRLMVRGSTLAVNIPSGSQVGEVSVGPSWFGHRDDIRFLAADPDSQPGGRRSPKQVVVGSVSKGGERGWPAEVQEIVDRSGATVATVGPVAGVSGGSGYRLEKLGPIDEPLNGILVAYLCALLDDKWTSAVAEGRGRGEPGL